MSNDSNILITYDCINCIILYLAPVLLNCNIFGTRNQHMLLVKYLTITNIHMTGNIHETKMFWQFMLTLLEWKCNNVLFSHIHHCKKYKWKHTHGNVWHYLAHYWDTILPAPHTFLAFLTAVSFALKILIVYHCQYCNCTSVFM